MRRSGLCAGLLAGTVAVVLAGAAGGDPVEAAAKKKNPDEAYVQGTLRKLEPGYQFKDDQGKVLLAGTKVEVDVGKAKKSKSKLKDPFFVMDRETKVSFATDDTKLAEGQYVKLWFEDGTRDAHKIGWVSKIVVAEDPDDAKKAKKKKKKTDE